MKTRRLASFAVAVVAIAVPLALAAQTFPTKVVRVVTPFPTGITPDIAARVLADRLSKVWNQQVIVEPRPGAHGFIAIGALKKAAPDGHELGFVSNAHLAINPNLFRSVPYDAEKDFALVSLVYRAPFFVAVSANGPYRNIADLIADAKARPGKLNYSSPYVGSPPHLGGALFAFLIGAPMQHVPYKEGPQVYASVVNGDVHWSLGTIGSTLPLVKAGKLKLVAIAAKKRMPSHPDVPTVEEAGGPAGHEVDSWSGVVAPQGTPAKIVQRLNTDIVAALANAEVQAGLQRLGVDPAPTNSTEFGAIVRSELKKYAELVKRTGATAE